MDQRTLLVFCSFSGDTEEVLAAVRASAGHTGARVAITRGGALAREAAAEGFPTLVYEYEGEPRSALGYGTMLLLGLLHRFGVFTTTEAEIEQTLAEVRRTTEAHAPGVPLAENPARALAQRVGDTVPVILADASLSGAAVRWQNQCNENGKRWAFAGMLPEAMHNIVEGMQRGESPSGFHVILLEDRSRPRIARLRLDAFQQHLSEADVRWTRLTFDGSGDLSILLQACVVGDWVSYYLASEAGVDPSPVPVISRLKARVADKVARDTVGAR
jgi:glucose/mannose-6-phosphate isomerase